MENTQEIKKRGKTEGYSSAKLKAKRKEKIRDAEVRQTVYEDLTYKQRIDLARSRRGESKREIARIEKLIKEEKARKNANN